MSLPFPIIDPIALSLGPIDIRWYALAYLVGFIGGWQLSMRLAPKFGLTAELLDDLIVWVVVGVIFGGRIGYVAFYNAGFYLENPQLILQLWNGGMSFHGGLIGVILAMIAFGLKNKVSFWRIADIAAICTPIGLFFGRLANFINAELVGRTTDVSWAFVFPGTDGTPRHPSQLYEALTEGLVLFALLLYLSRFEKVRNHSGIIAGTFLAFYGSARFLIEFTRQPDAHIGFLFANVTMGQVLCLPMIAFGLYKIMHKRHA